MKILFQDEILTKEICFYDSRFNLIIVTPIVRIMKSFLCNDHGQDEYVKVIIQNLKYCNRV